MSFRDRTGAHGVGFLEPKIATSKNICLLFSEAEGLDRSQQHS